MKNVRLYVVYVLLKCHTLQNIHYIHIVNFVLSLIHIKTLCM